VGIIEIVNTVRAHEDLNAGWEDGEEYYKETGMYGFPPRKVGFPDLRAPGPYHAP
jgi:hypothetical protein